MAKIDFEDDANYCKSYNVLVLDRKLPEGTLDESVLEFLRTDPETLDAVLRGLLTGSMNLRNMVYNARPKVDAATRRYQKMSEPVERLVPDRC